MRKRAHADIAVYLPSLEGGGAERVFVTLANGFSARGYSVDLVLVNATGPYIPLVDESVRIINLRKASVFKSIGALASYLREERPRCFLSGLSHANVAGLIAILMSGSPVRSVISERVSLSASRLYQKSVKDRATRLLMHLLYKRADIITVVAKKISDELVSELRLSPHKIETIFNPVERATILRALRGPPPHPWLNKGASSPVIIGCGRLTAQKDFHTLLRAFAILRTTRTAKLIILGEGEDRASLEREIIRAGLKDDVEMPGFVKRPVDYMAHCSVFVLSSRYEGLPGALVQALHCNVPLVSTDCPTGPEEILERGRWGQLVPVGDPHAMSVAIEKAIDGANTDTTARQIAFRESYAIDEYLRVLGLPPQK
ncbi:glycosyltransferase [Qipengyuania atrilutea]|uniref:Glycosyltransferase n=1 Tax=Qipengyuania atrilutea TaxID=2744473 RepID=A0A850GXV7_9SPHN|nr:glycosyltransferase [Actirhodobacter atriluteus]NVD44401.1 glycosyltransferase [Actirhodobacter atriluteus]